MFIKLKCANSGSQDFHTIEVMCTEENYPTVHSAQTIFFQQFVKCYSYNIQQRQLILVLNSWEYFQNYNKPTPQVLQKRKYLCATDYDEQYFNWKCLSDGKPPSHNSTWYTACGAPTPNPTQLTLIPAFFFIVAVVVFKNLHLNSFGDQVLESTKQASVNVDKKNIVDKNFVEKRNVVDKKSAAERKSAIKKKNK